MFVCSYSLGVNFKSVGKDTQKIPNIHINGWVFYRKDKKRGIMESLLLRNCYLCSQYAVKGGLTKDIKNN